MAVRADRGDTPGTLRVGSRTSALARWQTEHVREALSARGVASEFVGVRTAGDVHTGSLTEGGDGWFVTALEDALLQGEVDLAVHSLKDMPSRLGPGLEIAAVLARHDPRDVVVGATLEGLAPGARVGTSSPRRAAFVRSVRPDVDIVPIRGNVPRRLSLVDEGVVDAVVLALAGLERLGLGDRVTEFLSLDRFPPAPGQGAIAVEGRAGEATDAVRALDDEATRLAIEAERGLLGLLGGGCDLPLGAYAVVLPEGTIRLRARLVRHAGIDAETDVVGAMPQEAARLAAERLTER